MEEFLYGVNKAFLVYEEDTHFRYSFGINNIYFACWLIKKNSSVSSSISR